MVSHIVWKSHFFVCVPFSGAACADCGYCWVLLYWIRYFSTGIRWLIILRPGNLLLINFLNNFGIRNYFGCSVNCSISAGGRQTAKTWRFQINIEFGYRGLVTGPEAQVGVTSPILRMFN